MSRSRGNTVKLSTGDNHEAMTQLWHSLVDTIRVLPTIPPNKAEEEKKTLGDALEKLDMLMALRRGERSTPDPRATPSLVLPTSALPSPGSGSGVKRKRKGSFSLSPAPALDLNAIHPSPLLTANSASTRPSTPMSREATGKHRRELYADQLPLQPGRKVAFKLPAVKAKGDGDTNVTGGSSGDDWILATVKRCILQDKMRYEVQDVDDGNTYNTTLRSIIPLPDPDSATHLSSHPSNLEDFPRESIVLALYPDTTSFYRATVVAAPIPGTGHGLGIRGQGANSKADSGAKKGMYRLLFVDDDGNVQDVQKDYVVAFPG
ncbi:SAGA-associated factor 29 [Cryptococcus neoformans C23]|uniref:SAGA-associated factor 29 n=2 Tax=Cryptococcus neoformans TaxID=5207 RepID=A0A854Q217_CRYNE|nr:SAGA-associated factor 29 [Cryptococcus neoformans var. grubii H99]OWZ26957.1 SAGA-associated factor 29 [Cryptococcus neoformans var. grubii AD2-60a]OWZ27999.1 SAGA-associated factor 29 [Cryptococcus neoformans var. grubii AD1-83a]OWZ38818.1 SAGA-associated factor 29 [Cryptococcus neoformans var. grubii C23]OXC81215.1 SAGA-associated factor 29 [Cryptococcus neoformans var. grubii AD1-7a]OXG10773.1 SAGA-associated factor 29 [Cryptococcus neoformans var. grubii Tu259-1]OXG26345.1 SAGA-associ|eukprot:XP_012053463.1 SAGA-associated factor 29 [Cryptococcus neoformans var. grubii H99]